MSSYSNRQVLAKVMAHDIIQDALLYGYEVRLKDDDFSGLYGDSDYTMITVEIQGRKWREHMFNETRIIVFFRAKMRDGRFSLSFGSARDYGLSGDEFASVQDVRRELRYKRELANHESETTEDDGIRFLDWCRTSKTRDQLFGQIRKLKAALEDQGVDPDEVLNQEG